MRVFPVQSNRLALADKQSQCVIGRRAAIPQRPPSVKRNLYFAVATTFAAGVKTASISAVTASMLAMPSTPRSLPLA